MEDTFMTRKGLKILFTQVAFSVVHIGNDHRAVLRKSQARHLPLHRALTRQSLRLLQCTLIIPTL